MGQEDPRGTGRSWLDNVLGLGTAAPPRENAGSRPSPPIDVTPRELGERPDPLAGEAWSPPAANIPATERLDSGRSSTRTPAPKSASESESALTLPPEPGLPQAAEDGDQNAREVGGTREAAVSPGEIPRSGSTLGLPWEVPRDPAAKFSAPPLSPSSTAPNTTGIHRRIEELVSSPFGKPQVTSAQGSAPVADVEGSTPAPSAASKPVPQVEASPPQGPRADTWVPAREDEPGRAVVGENPPARTLSSQPTPAQEVAPPAEEPLSAREPTPAPQELKADASGAVQEAAEPPAAPSSSPAASVPQREPPATQLVTTQESRAVAPDRPNPIAEPADSQPRSAEGKPAGTEVSSRALLVRQGPVVEVEAFGPERVLTGQVARYEIVVHNAGREAAESFVLEVTLPGWVELASSKPSVGQVRAASAGGANGPGEVRQLYWEIGRFEPGKKERLEVQLLPRRSESLNLAVSWSHRPAESRALIEVQEPRLEVRLASSRDVVGRVRQPVEVRIANRGTAPAENVQLRFSLEGAGDLSPASVLLSRVDVGEEKTVLVELTALRAGAMTLACQAVAQGGFQGQFSERLMVREPRLALRWQVPTTILVGTEVEATLVLSNQGDAPAQDTVVRLQLPSSAEIQELPPQVEREAGSGDLVWKVGSIGPGQEKLLTLSVRAREVGQLACSAVAASGPWEAKALANPDVQGFARLELALRDPGAPSPVGTDVPYEIRVENRGTKTIDQWEVAVFFSWGIEPVAAEGAPSLIAPGQVIFGRVGPIAPGEVKTLRVIARAETAGTHACRVELYSAELPTRLVAQDVTPFYQPGAPRSQPERALAGADQSPPTPAMSPRQGGPVSNMPSKGAPQEAAVVKATAQPTPASPTPRVAQQPTSSGSGRNSAVRR
ncbi:MAG: hypothetical protein NZ899_13205 [Thermoguttaceae bacterium]|nr:hypothetical protein [Thermoguttaceae bacterium]MDW8080073.1 hypothetical protein [Thermoguttaceae bacterium]